MFYLTYCSSRKCFSLKASPFIKYCHVVIESQQNMYLLIPINNVFDAGKFVT